MKNFLLAGGLALALFIRPGRAEDWPEFRGPTGQGHSAERGLPVEWSESRNVTWRIRVPGAGWSSPVVSDGRIWLTTAVDERDSTSFRAMAFDAVSGRERVNVEILRIPGARLVHGCALSGLHSHPLVKNAKNSHASPTPIVAGDRVYVHFGTDGTAAITTAGAILWKTRLPYDSRHGAGGSPALYRDLLLVNCDGADQAYVVALDTATGDVRWKTSRRKPWDQAYSTPLVIRVGSEDQLISVGAYRATAYEPMSGKEIWRVAYADGFSNVPRPVYGDGLVYIATGFQQPALLAIRPDGSGDVTGSRVAWRLERGAPHTPSPVLVGDELYVVSDLGVVTCLDARSGRIHWQNRLGGNYSASPVFADVRLYFFSEEGEINVLAPGKIFSRLAVNRLDGAILASMAVSSGALFIRTDQALYRIELSGKRSSQTAP